MNESTTVPAGPARLRGHHLMCLHFFDGEGYSADFVENLRATLAVAESDGMVLVEGADDVCASCSQLRDGICDDQPEIDRLDRLACSLLDARPGTRLVWAEVSGRMPDILDAWYVGACEECTYLRVCTAAGLRDLCETAAGEPEAESR